MHITTPRTVASIIRRVSLLNIFRSKSWATVCELSAIIPFRFVDSKSITKLTTGQIHITGFHQREGAAIVVYANTLVFQWATAHQASKIVCGGKRIARSAVSTYGAMTGQFRRIYAEETDAFTSYMDCVAINYACVAAFISTYRSV